MAEPEKIKLKSLDIAEEKRKQLKAIFPEAFAENKVDFDQLKRALGELVEPAKERFGLNWAGKAECMEIIQLPSVATLKPVRGESVNFDETENLFIEGDNLEVLKLLQKSYFGKVKMIYIDPPYNTGKEFIYPDKYAETLDTYLEYTGQKDNNGRRFSTNTDTVGRYHSNWLNMMYPRLYLAKNLLRDDGVIFISIDDNEQANLKKLCDEMFGEDNFVANFIWQRAYAPVNMNKHASPNHDFIICYAKNFEKLNNFTVSRDKAANARYKNPDDDSRGVWQSDNLSVGPAIEKNIYPIITPSGKEVLPPKGYSWRFSKERFKELISDNRIWFGQDGNNTPRYKRFLSDVKDGITPLTIWTYKEVGHSQDARKETKDLFDGEAFFDYPKPVKLMQRLSQISTSENDIILDFFAGSATTAHGVMQLNAKDNHKRKFICVQLPEKTNPKSEAHKAGYKNVADIAKERIRRAGKKIEEELNRQLDFNGGPKLDIGFKVFKLDKSNFKVWEGDVEKIENLEKQLFDHIDHIDKDAKPEAILYELLLKSGFSITTKVEKLQLAGKDVFSIAEGALLICLDETLNQEVIDAIADANPLQVFCLDDGFKGNDQLKTNALQTFKARAQKEESQIVFRTI